MVEFAHEAVQRRGWTAAQVRELINEPRPSRRYELIDGELLVTPSPGAPHQLAVAALWKELEGYVKREHIGMAMISPADIELIPENITQPDVFVMPAHVPGNPELGFVWTDIKELILAVEVLSPSSIRNDRIIKRDFYMKAAVQEYWVVDLDARIVERWVTSRNIPQIDRTTLTWQPADAHSALVIDLKDLFEEIWSDYRKIGRPR